MSREISIPVTTDPAALDVWCEGCQRKITIAREGVTVCTCGVRHTFVPGASLASGTS